MPSFPFKKSREAEITAKHKASIADELRIERQIAQGQQEVARLRESAVNAVVTGAPPEVVAKANAEIAAAEQAVKTAEVALAQVQSRTVELERERDALANKRLASATSEQIDAMIAEVTAVKAEHRNVCARLHEIGRKVVTFVPEAATLETFGGQAPTAIGDVIDMVVALMKTHQRQVLSGHQPPTIRNPDEPAQLKLVASGGPKTTAVRTVRPIAFTTAGVTRPVGRWNIINLPEKLADKALALGAVASINDGRYQHHRPDPTPALAACICLDEASQKLQGDPPAEVAEPVAPAPEPKGIIYGKQSPHVEQIISSHVQQAAPGFLAAAGARSLDKE